VNTGREWADQNMKSSFVYIIWVIAHIHEEKEDRSREQNYWIGSAPGEAENDSLTNHFAPKFVRSSAIVPTN